MATYGQNFKRLRGKTPQEVIARKLRLKRQANISAIERSTRVPSPELIFKHADALGCAPSDLLRDVDLDYELIKSGDLDSAVARSRFIAQLKHRVAAMKSKKRA